MKKVLIVDDCPVVREIISDWMVSECGVKVVLADGVTEAIIHLNEAPIDFIVCDYEMPDGNGLDVLTYLKKEALAVPMILFTGRYDLKLIESFPLIRVINDKNYETLFEFISNKIFKPIK